MRKEVKYKNKWGTKEIGLTVFLSIFEVLFTTPNKKSIPYLWITSKFWKQMKKMTKRASFHSMIEKLRTLKGKKEIVESFFDNLSFDTQTFNTYK